jgi:hypothetical protein
MFLDVLNSVIITIYFIDLRWLSLILQVRSLMDLTEAREPQKPTTPLRN